MPRDSSQNPKVRPLARHSGVVGKIAVQQMKHVSQAGSAVPCGTCVAASAAGRIIPALTAGAAIAQMATISAGIIAVLRARRAHPAAAAATARRVRPAYSAAVAATTSMSASRRAAIPMRSAITASVIRLARTTASGVGITAVHPTMSASSTPIAAPVMPSVVPRAANRATHANRGSAGSAPTLSAMGVVAQTRKTIAYLMAGAVRVTRFAVSTVVFRGKHAKMGGVFPAHAIAAAGTAAAPRTRPVCFTAAAARRIRCAVRSAVIRTRSARTVTALTCVLASHVEAANNAIRAVASACQPTAVPVAGPTSSVAADSA